MRTELERRRRMRKALIALQLRGGQCASIAAGGLETARERADFEREAAAEFLAFIESTEAGRAMIAIAEGEGLHGLTTVCAKLTEAAILARRR